MTSDHLALTSDGVKYTPVAVDEDRDRQNVVPHIGEHAECLPFATDNTFMNW